jgi:signal transduction histidine kinase
MSWAWSSSFRTRILLIVVMLAVLPLGLVGAWLTRSAARGGERLLRDRLHVVLADAESEIGARWIRLRSRLLDVIEASDLQRRLAGNEADPELATLLTAVTGSVPDVIRIAVFDPAGGERGTVRLRDDTDDALAIAVPVYANESGVPLGTLIATLPTSSLVNRTVSVPTAAGIVLAAFDPRTGASLLPLPFDPVLLDGNGFTWGGESWAAARSTLAEPPLVLVAAAPLTPFAIPFREAARRGTWLLVIVAVCGIGLTVLATARMTRSLTRLATAAHAVSAGDLDQEVDATDRGEIGRVAHAFNTMTASLRGTLRTLADREAEAAASTFAAALAHEVRNPLTAIRLDMQVVEEHLDGASPAKEIQARALREIDRLDEVVGNALDQVRRGHLGTRVLDLAEPLTAAVQVASPTFDAVGIDTPVLPDGADLHVRGESGALEQLFLNLLLNAAQAQETGGTVRVSLDRDGAWAVVSITDAGPGIPDDVRERIFQPFFSTRDDGTGLGLPIAQRIAKAHGGEVVLAEGTGTGTTVQVRLPLAA